MATKKVGFAALLAVAVGLTAATYVVQAPTKKLDAFCNSTEPYVELETPLYVLLYDTANKGPIHIQYTVEAHELKPEGAPRTGTFWYPDCSEQMPSREAFRNGYDRGHLIADRLSDNSPYRDWAWFMGAITPMHYRLNRGPFAALEGVIYNEAKTRPVSVKIVLVYSKPMVPDEYIVEADGLGMFVFPNKDPGTKKLEEFRWQR